MTEIIETTGLGQANVSRHLKTLTQMGIVSRHPQGVNVFYRIADPTIFELCNLVCERLAMQCQHDAEQLKQLDVLKRL